MVEYSKVHVKLSDKQLKKLKTSVKNKTGTTLKNEFKNVSWKRFTTWIVTDNKTKKQN